MTVKLHLPSSALVTVSSVPSGLVRVTSTPGYGSARVPMVPLMQLVSSAYGRQKVPAAAWAEPAVMVASSGASTSPRSRPATPWMTERSLGRVLTRVLPLRALAAHGAV